MEIIGHNEAPKITRIHIPRHLFGEKPCPGTGKYGRARLKSFVPQFRTADVYVDCRKCNTTLITTINY